MNTPGSAQLLFLWSAIYNKYMKNSTKKWLALGAGLSALAAVLAFNEKIYRFIFSRHAKPLKFSDDQLPNEQFSQIEEKKKTMRQALKSFESESFERTSDDGKHLCATLFPASQMSKKFVICVHGYRTDGIHEFCAFVPYYLSRHINVLLIDQRSHGESEGQTITFGLHEAHDLLEWIHWLQEHFGQDIEIILHGISMGAATVMEVSSIVPDQVKFIVEDCGYTRARDEFRHTLSMVHLPEQLYPWISSLFFVHNLDFLEHIVPVEEVAHSRVPILFVHGTRDTLVPFEMAIQLYDACRQPKDKLFVYEADHAQSYYRQTGEYQAKIDHLIDQYMKKDD